MIEKLRMGRGMLWYGIVQYGPYEAGGPVSRFKSLDENPPIVVPLSSRTTRIQHSPVMES